jgi:hypothetical protein
VKTSDWVLCIAPVLAFAVFLVYFFHIRTQPFVRHLVANPLVYDDQAKQILRALPPSQPFFLSPLYPSFLAIIYWLTHGSRSVVMVCQGALLAVNVWLIGAISARLFSRRVALVASALPVFYWTFYYFAGELLPTTLCLTFLLAGTLLYIDRDSRRLQPGAIASLGFAGLLFLGHSMPALSNLRGLIAGAALAAPQNAYVATLIFFLVFAAGALLLLLLSRARAEGHGNLVASGLLLGTSTLVWSGTLLFAGFLTLRLLLGRTRRGMVIGLFLAAVGVPLLASLLHNFVIASRAIPVTTSFGVNVFIGNNAASDGMNPFNFGEGDEVRMQADRLGLAGAERSAFYRGRAVEFIRREPARWARLLGRKLLIAVSDTEVDNNADMSEREAAWKRVFIPVLSFGTVFPLALVGMVRVIWCHRRGYMLVIGYISFLLVAVTFFACERFRLPGIAFLVPLAAVGVESILRDLAGRKIPHLAASVVVVVAAAVISNLDLADIADVEFASITINKAHVQRLEGDFAGARSLISVALQREPGNAGAHFQLGAMKETEGDLLGAATHYLDSLERDPFFYGPYAGMKRILEEARINASYLDVYVGNLIDMKEHTEAKARLIGFLQGRLP